MKSKMTGKKRAMALKGEVIKALNQLDGGNAREVFGQAASLLLFEELFRLSDELEGAVRKGDEQSSKALRGHLLARAKAISELLSDMRPRFALGLIAKAETMSAPGGTLAGRGGDVSATRAVSTKGSTP